ncbi:hypothetical protein GOBAR_DD31519 [Gossypium barbadense]|nr:hypothetical protein GOBAR_DD31519 [Gossypium barbadense]
MSSMEIDFKQYQLRCQLRGHEDDVRGICVCGSEGIATSSRDRTVRFWSLDSSDKRKYVSSKMLLGHSSFVGPLAWIAPDEEFPEGGIVSGGMDTMVFVWDLRTGEKVQSLKGHQLQVTGVVLDGGDIISSSVDCTLRRWRKGQPVESWEAHKSAIQAVIKLPSGELVSDLPGLEALQIPGTSDGQTKIVREGDNGVAYSWNMREQKWDKIGEVVDGPDDSMKRSVLDGVQYDYVFDVDIGDGEPIRKLPYNRSDNPYDTADKWLLKENLPLSYRQQIVEFILQNTGQKDFNIDPTFRDPYTGSSAYVPGQPSYASGIAAKPTFKHIPKRGMLVFDAAQFDGILKKISEFNNTLLADSEKKDLSLTEPEISRLGAIVKILKDTSHYHTSRFADVDIALLLKLLKSWPVAMIFPVIDMLRMTVLHPDGAIVLLRHVEVNDVVMEMIMKATTDPALPANLLTSIRAVTNFFKNSSYYSWLQKHRSDILDAFSSCLASPNKNLQLAYSTLILNYAVLLIEKQDEEGQSHVLSAALEIAEQETLEIDSRFRALVAIGSLMLEGLVKKLAMDFDVGNIAKAAKASKEAKIAEIGADIELLTKQS